MMRLARLFNNDTGTDTALAPSQAHYLLSSPRRLAILYFIHQQPNPTPAGEIAEHIASLENNVDRAQLTGQQRKRVYIAITQTHLPTLADAEVIQYDDQVKQVWPTPLTAKLLRAHQHVVTIL